MMVEGLDERDVKKALLSFVYNLNVPSRWGQSPFSNVTIDMTVPNHMKYLAPQRGEELYFVRNYREFC
jgi:ribonucleoside-triphosphate reductase